MNLLCEISVIATEDMAAEKAVFARNMNDIKISLLYSISSIALLHFDVADTLGHGTRAVDEVDECFVVGVDLTTRGEVSLVTILVEYIVGDSLI